MPWAGTPSPHSKPPRCYYCHRAPDVALCTPTPEHQRSVYSVRNHIAPFRFTRSTHQSHGGQAKPAPAAFALRALWSPSSDLQKTLRNLLRQWRLKILARQVPCHALSFKTEHLRQALVGPRPAVQSQAWHRMLVHRDGPSVLLQELQEPQELDNIHDHF